MSFFKQLFPFMKVKKKKEFSYIIKDVDPNSVWEIVGELGDGSFGKVYKAQHKTENILAAAKIIDVNDENELEDFMVEIDILSEVKHKHIVGLHHTYYYNNKLWMMLEFCAGGALDDLMLEIERGLTEPEIKAICYQLFEGLSILHSNKVIHRDLKAGNLLLAGDGNIKMADFGVSAKNKKTLQKRTTFIGTPYWMAPEVVVTETCKDDPYDYKADIWSAGVTIIELAQMVPPYHAMHPMRVLFKIPKADPPTLENSNKWSKDLHDFLARCVVKSPEMRSTAAELLKHPFLANGVDVKTLKDLYNEAKAEVIEEIEDLPEDTEEKDNDERLKSSGSFEYLLDEEKDLDKEKENEKEKEKDDEKKEEGENEVFEDKKVEEEPKKEEEKVEDVAKKDEDTEDVPKEGESEKEVSKPEQDTEEISREIKEPEETPKSEEEKPVDIGEKKEDKAPEESKEEKEPEPSEEKKETTKTEEVTEKKDEKEGEKDSADKYSSRLDNILDEMEETDEKTKEPEAEKKEEEKEEEKEKEPEAAKEPEGAPQPEEDATKTTEDKEEEKKEDEKEEEKKDDDQINKDGLKEVPIYIDEGRNKTENKEDNKKQEEPETPSGQLKEVPIYTDDGDVPIENKDNKKITEESATDGKKLTNGAILAAELSKETVPKKEGEAQKTGEKHFKTLKRTRKFATEDGKIVTETTSRVVDVSGEDFKNALLKEQQQRKLNLRDMKVFQRQEQKQGMELMSKIRRQWEAQEQRFEQEIQDIEKKFEGDLDTLSRNQKREIEKLELTQNADLRASSRKMKQDQEKELRKFKENLKEEGKKSKKDIDKLPRPVRKETWKKRKDELDVSHRQAEHEFLAMQQTEFEKFYKQMIDLHRQKMFEMEMQFLESKHERKRSNESEKWEMEYRHLNERHQLAKTQLKETFFLQRSQMLNRHQKEVEQHQHLTKLQEDEMKRRHEIERKRLPKIQRNEIKVKAQNYRKILRDKKVSLEQEKDLMREFEDEERKRARSEYEKMLLRQDLEAEELKTSTEAALKELQLLQNEKRHMLMESETLKLKERDDKHNAQMMAWKAELGPRKKGLEEEFAREKREQQLFYARGGETENQPPNDLRVPSDRDSMDGSGGSQTGSQTGSQKTPDDTSSSTGSLEV